MNIVQLKFAAWLAVGVLTAGLAFYVVTFIKTTKSLRPGLDPKQVEAALSDAGPAQVETDDLVPYDELRRLVLPSCDRCAGNKNCKHFNWTGKQEVPVAVVGPGDEAPVVRTPVKDLIRVLMVKADLGDPAGSSLFLVYKPAAAVQGRKLGLQLKVGDTLHAPHTAIKVKAITADGVLFSFEDGRDDELLGPAEFDAKTTIVVVDEQGIMWPKVTNAIPKGAVENWNPKQTVATGTNTYRLGDEDLKEFADHWDAILGRDVRHQRHKDPRTGKYDGIEIVSVTPGSIAARHGATEGDVVKSVNGNPVTSTQEAIQFVKNHKDEYTTWEVVIENRGRTRTMTYHSRRQ